MSEQRSFGRSALLAVGQVALIVLSVLLALAANEWRQRADDEALAAQALASLRAEFENNRAQAERALSYREQLLARLDSGGTSIQLRPAFISDNAWPSAQAAGALRHLPYEIVAQAGRIHEMQSVYRDITVAGGNLLYFGNVFGGEALPSNHRGFIPMLQDMLFFERDLIRQYDAAFVLMDSLESTP